MDDACAPWRDAIGGTAYYAIYRKGEIAVLGIADSPAGPAVEEWVDVRETGHAHAIDDRCPLSRIDEEVRRDRLGRYPVRAIAPYRCMTPEPSCDGWSTGRNGTRHRAPGVRAGDGLRRDSPRRWGDGHHDDPLPALLSEADRMPPFARQPQAESGSPPGMRALSISI